jgi:hypothetical protein
VILWYFRCVSQWREGGRERERERERKVADGRERRGANGYTKRGGIRGKEGSRY